MKTLTLKEIVLTDTSFGTRVTYNYDAPESLSQYIKEQSLFVDFPGDVRGVPESILGIPFVGIMLSVGMLVGIEVRVPTLDEIFYKSLTRLETVFQKMYPAANIQYRVSAESLENPQPTSKDTEEACSLFFTGGIDATSALLELRDKHPLLIYIWGADMHLNDNDSYEELKTYFDSVKQCLGVEYSFIRTNAREMFDEHSLNQLCKKRLGHKKNHGWWASIAHILSMSATTMPWLWKNGISTHYIGSSYHVAANTFDSNNCEVIGALEYTNGGFVSVDQELSRNQKTKKIVDYQKETNTPFLLKVCWYRTEGQNCSACEKCYRTILDIISNHGDPNKFGFVVTAESLLQMKKYVETHNVAIAFWKPIQKTFLLEKEYWIEKPEIAWILTIRLNSFKTFLMRVRRRLFG